jgi:hypothetical protein
MADGTPLPATDRPATDKAASSAPVDLRPLTTSELIDRGFSLYRAHFAGFLLLALLSQIAPLLSQVLATTFKFNIAVGQLNNFLDKPKVIFTDFGIFMAMTLICQVIYFCFEVVIAFYIADAYLGKTPSVRDSLRKFSTCIGSAIWTCLLSRLLLSLTAIFPFMTGAVIFFYQAFYPPDTFPLLLLMGGISVALIVASLVPVLVVFMRLMVTVPAVALEGLSGWKAVKRSSTLVRYDPGLGILYWGEMRLSFLLLPLFVIELLLLSITSLPLLLHQVNDVVQHGSSAQDAPPDVIVIFSQILIFLAGSFILPLYSIAMTLFYYDVRIRREGFDLEFMARNRGGRS